MLLNLAVKFSLAKSYENKIFTHNKSFCFNCSVFFSLDAYPQITIDNTLKSNSKVSTQDYISGNRYISINGGEARGKNLFHSFYEFSVRINENVNFNNHLSIDYIIARVTGQNPSNILGEISANGNANLFILNPNGFFFGSQSKLNIGGSFLATTANSIEFSDKSIFSTENKKTTNLTISTPFGLWFGNRIGSIKNESFGDSTSGDANLQVLPRQTFALIGGDVVFENQGSLIARGGRIEIGSVAPNNFVHIIPDPLGFKFNYSEVKNFRDINFSQAYLSVSDRGLAPNSGYINLTGDSINISDETFLLSFNNGLRPSGSISINASSNLSLLNNSEVIAVAFSDGSAADINISSQTLRIDNLSRIETFSLFSSGKAGNILANVSDLLLIDNLGYLGSQSVAGGDAGSISVSTERLILKNGGRIAGATFFGSGNGASIEILASQELLASGSAFFDNDINFSGIFSSSTNFATGEAGTIKINAGRVNIIDGAKISVSANSGSLGSAGRITISSPNLLVSGIESRIEAISESPSQAGGVLINSREVLINNYGQISVNSIGSGPAGSIVINSDVIRLEERGKLTSTTRSTQGDIILNTDALVLLGNSRIDTNALGFTSGGNILVNAEVVAALQNSDVTANSLRGSGGKVEIKAETIFGLQPITRQDLQNLLGAEDPSLLDPNKLPTSDATAISQEGGPSLEGTVSFQTPEVDPTQALSEISEEVIDSSKLVVNSCNLDPQKKLIRTGSLVITGNGGLPPTPNDHISPQSILPNWITTETLTNSEKQSQIDKVLVTKKGKEYFLEPIIEANAWIVLDDGKILLTAESKHSKSSINLPPKFNCV